jgi:hypothetical protein
MTTEVIDLDGDLLDADLLEAPTDIDLVDEVDEAVDDIPDESPATADRWRPIDGSLDDR